jgi:hypothetical protein
LKHRDQKSNAIEKGVPMITMAIGLAAGVFYWLAWYKLAFWILIYAIIYGGLGAWRGDNQRHALLRGDSALTTAVLIPVAWHIGGLAGYW